MNTHEDHGPHTPADDGGAPVGGSPTPAPGAEAEHRDDSAQYLTVLRRLDEAGN
ncbi:hypothetical protein BRM3_09665 [Brachybacterium huguangmaarense]|uniref:Metal-binding protein n=1 Tax=Brachybacterium huguangmaarense TaxID=1652028 RepID=A0ABY6FY98_9MICO|nr:hypothetical protein [Brachybacterium huguangmaarense]UYG15905.1 hypothetical protein BRM3_09665 [Brachybacterium huguangmaarense]